MIQDPKTIKINMLTPLAFAFALLIPGLDGFAMHPARASPRASSTLVPRHVLPDSITDSDNARAYFYLWFFGGSGGAGIALRQFPLLLDKFKELEKMEDVGPTQGGETVGISALCFYPRDISRADLAQVVGNRLSVEKMVETGPKPNYLSEKGYLCYESFQAANKKCNPLTVRAVFDAMSTGDVVSPDVAQACLDSFTNDDGAFKNALLKTKLIGYSSVATLLFLLGPIVGSTCLDGASFGWFPEWPGNDNLPWSLLIGPGFWTIPEYWT